MWFTAIHTLLWPAMFQSTPFKKRYIFTGYFKIYPSSCVTWLQVCISEIQLQWCNNKMHESWQFDWTAKSFTKSDLPRPTLYCDLQCFKVRHSKKEIVFLLAFWYIIQVAVWPGFEFVFLRYSSIDVIIKCMKADNPTEQQKVSQKVIYPFPHFTVTCNVSKYDIQKKR